VLALLLPLPPGPASASAAPPTPVSDGSVTAPPGTTTAAASGADAAWMASTDAGSTSCSRSGTVKPAAEIAG
jgi:hypothetical protein